MDGDHSTARDVRRATSYDVAQLAGVSQSAVSRCFRDGASVSAATRAKVVRAAQALSYAPDKIARSLITQRSRIVAVLVSEATTIAYPTLLPHLGQAVQDAQHRMLLFILPGSAPGGAGAALADILGYRVDAVIAGLGVPDGTMAACAAHGIPVVTYNTSSRHPWASTVGCDDAGAMDALATHLRAGGARRLHVLGGPPGAPAGESRLRAGLQAAAAHGLEVLGVTHADYSYAGGRAAAAALAAGRPDAVVSVNDSMALGVLDGFRHDLGLRVPEDVAVAGYDNVAEGERPPYGLTTLAQPVEALTRTALRMALERLDGTALPGEQRLMPVRLVVRSSTRPVA